MTKRTRTLIVGVILLIGLGVGGWQLPVPYAAMGPGPTFNTLGTGERGEKVITFEGRRPHRTTGHLNMTTVSELDNLDLLTAIRGWLSSSETVVPRSLLFPPNKSQKQVQHEQQQQFTSSQDSATNAALSYLGYPKRVVVSELDKGSSAARVLQIGDTITTLGGRPVRTLDAYHKALTKVPAGGELSVGYVRDGKPGTARVAAGKDPVNLGFDVVYEPRAPFTVSINLPNIGGPSAGLMFALGIITKAGGQNLTGGKFIAGTGTITNAGDVGPIGGITLKMLAARRAGATIFLVPAGNCSEARGGDPAGLRIVKVSTLDGAINALRSLRTGGSVPTC